MTDKYSNAYRIGRKEGYNEIMSQMRDIIDKCYNMGYKDAMEFVCEWLKARKVLTDASLEGFRKAMEEHLRKQMEE